MAKAKRSAESEDPFQLLYQLITLMPDARGAVTSPWIVEAVNRVAEEMRVASPEAAALAADLLRPILIEPKRQRNPKEWDRLVEVVEKLHVRRDPADMRRLRVQVRPLRHMQRVNHDKLKLGVDILESMVELRRLKIQHDVYFDAAANMAMHLIAGETCHC